jgi:hypothetical protein
VNSMSDLFHEGVPFELRRSRVRGDGADAAAHLPDPDEAAGADGGVHLKLKGDASRDWDGVSYEATSRRILAYDQRGKDIHWIIVGGESGGGARRCDVDWVRWIISQCRKAGVPVFCKQLGADVYDINTTSAGEFPDEMCWPDGTKTDCHSVLLKDSKGGNMEEWPADLRVRQMPAVAGGGK